MLSRSEIDGRIETTAHGTRRRDHDKRVAIDFPILPTSPPNARQQGEVGCGRKSIAGRGLGQVATIVASDVAAGARATVA